MTTDVRPAVGTNRPGRRRVGFGAALILLRILATGHALLVLSQPISIGQYLSGVYDWLGVHAMAASAVIITAMVLSVSTIVYALSGGRAWTAAVGPVLFLTEGLQIGMGYQRNLALHLPLGVLIVVATLAFAGWTWSRGAAHPRGGR
jgi:polyferredoxin